MKTKNKYKLLTFTAIFFAFFLLYYFRLTKHIMNVVESDVEAELSTALYSTINDIFKENQFIYQDIFSVETNDNTSFVFVDNLAVNAFIGTVSLAVCDRLKEFADSGTDFPVGVFSCIPILSGYGRTVSFKTLNIVSVKCDLKSSFEGMGINQTRHAVYATIIPDVTISALGRSKKKSVEISVLVFENIIIGKVPDTYFGITVL